jgi:glycosyltransferase involved in cell wall biosynthesis
MTSEQSGYVATTKPMYPFVSIVIPTYNRSDLLLCCMESLLRQDYPREKYEIIVVDDGSHDKTETLFQKENIPSTIKIIYYRHPENRGIAAARNLGFDRARGEIIASCDDDCSVAPDWLFQIVETFRHFSEAAAVGGSIINPTDSALAWAVYLLEFSDWLPSGKIRYMKNIQACNIAYRRRMIAGKRFTGGRNESFEDSRFNHELIKAKGKIVFNPAIRVFHYRWANGFTREDFINNQKRYARGFLNSGYKVHGIWGDLLMRWKFFNLFCPRIILVFLRCLRAGHYVGLFLMHLPRIIEGEWIRSRTINSGLST